MLAVIFGLLPGITKATYILIYVFSALILFGILKKTEPFSKANLLILTLFYLFIVFQQIILQLAGVAVDYMQVMRNIAFISLFFLVYEIRGWIAHIVVKNSNKLVYFMLALLILFYVFDVKLFITQLESQGRLYVFGFPIYVVLQILAIRQKQYHIVFFIFVILSASNGKAIIVADLFLIAVAMSSGVQFNVGKFVFTFGLFAIILYNSVLFERIEMFMINGDAWRLEEVHYAYNSIIKDYFSPLFGNGLGVPYNDSYGYGVYANLTGLEENSSFDIHNLFISIILKYGVLGSLLFYYAWKRYLKNTGEFAFTIFVLISGMSSPWIIQSIEITSLAIAMGILQNEKNYFN